jgi:predicted dehydrogenase
MARLHAIALSRLREQGIIVGGTSYPINFALYGRDAAKLANLAAEVRPMGTSTDMDNFIDSPEIDIIDNCLVNSLHFGPLSRAIDKGKHVYTDKPLTNDLHEAQELLAAATRAGVRHGIVQNMRYQAGPAEAKRRVDRGDLGRIFHARVVFGYFVPETVTNRPAWFYKKEIAGGGVVHDMMAHFFDLIRYTLGPIESLFCLSGIYFPERVDAAGKRFKVEVEDSCAVIMKMKCGALVDVFASWVRRQHEEIPFFEIDGELGSLVFSFNELRWQPEGATSRFSYDPTRVQRGSFSGWEDIALPTLDPFEEMLRDYLTGIITSVATSPTWEDAVENQRLIELAYLSESEGTAQRP